MVMCNIPVCLQLLEICCVKLKISIRLQHVVDIEPQAAQAFSRCVEAQSYTAILYIHILDSEEFNAMQGNATSIHAMQCTEMQPTATPANG